MVSDNEGILCIEDIPEAHDDSDCDENEGFDEEGPADSCIKCGCDIFREEFSGFKEHGRCAPCQFEEEHPDGIDAD